MSRIHEALKKAAKERSAHLVGDESGEPSEVLVEMHSQTRAEKPSIANRAEQQRILAIGNQAGPLRYEELVRRCSHSTWEIDTRPNIFQGPGARNGGRKGFALCDLVFIRLLARALCDGLLITSSVPAEGKTFVTSNLAQSIVQQTERRVLIIDADMRAPRVHVELGAPNRPGLTDYPQGRGE